MAVTYSVTICEQKDKGIVCHLELATETASPVVLIFEVCCLS